MLEEQAQLECTKGFTINEKLIVPDPFLSLPLEKQAFMEIVKSGSRFVADNMYHIANSIEVRQNAILHFEELPFFFECTLTTETMYVGGAREQISALNFTKKLQTRKPNFTLKVRIEGKGRDINKTYFSSVYKTNSQVMIKKKIKNMLEYLNRGDHLHHIKQFIN